jgi:hypothetical protein
MRRHGQRPLLNPVGGIGGWGRVHMLNAADPKRFTERLNSQVLEAFGIAHSCARQVNKLLCYDGGHRVLAIDQAKNTQHLFEGAAQDNNLIRVKCTLALQQLVNWHGTPLTSRQPI